MLDYATVALALATFILAAFTYGMLRKVKKDRQIRLIEKGN